MTLEKLFLNRYEFEWVYAWAAKAIVVAKIKKDFICEKEKIILAVYVL